jgi:uncharacterized membrane protein (TIGR01666 family)
MRPNTQHIRYFLFSQYLTDGVRITLEIVLPAVICSLFGNMGIGLLLSTGALCVSMADAPGPIEHKRNGMMYCNVIIFIISILTGLANHNIILLGLLILLASFVFTMFAVFGVRASSVGLAALLVMILRMDDVKPLQKTFTDSILLLCGGTWYMLLALIVYQVRPFRQAQRSLGGCIHETSKLLLIKAALYDPGTNVKEEYQKLIDQQVIVNEKQDEVRQLLFKSKEIVKDPSPTGQIILLTFIDVIDLYEQITATWYDYSQLRERFSSTGILPKISALIKDMAHGLDEIGFSIQSNIPYKKQFELVPSLNQLKANIDAAKIENTSNLVLKKILINFRNIGERVDAIAGYFSENVDLKTRSKNRVDHTRFVSRQEISFSILRDNLNLNAGVFRHALRMTITCMLGFIILQFISYGYHSYWVLLTIVFILKPGYSLTKERNIQRIAGTVAGGIVGIIILATIKDRNVLFAFIVFFMIGTYTFQRLNYIVTVIFMTPYILILFSFLGWGFLNVIEERVLDTAIASVLAFLASYFLFPHWESTQIDTYISEVLRANITYLQKLRDVLIGNKPSLLDYKLARKELYVSTANLSAAFSRMLSEPKSKQQNAALINELVVLNNVLSSNIASLFAINTTLEQQAVTKEILQTVNRSIAALSDTLHVLDTSYLPEQTETCSITPIPAATRPDQQMKEHVDFIYKIAVDIRKVVQKINSK